MSSASFFLCGVSRRTTLTLCNSNQAQASRSCQPRTGHPGRCRRLSIYNYINYHLYGLGMPIYACKLLLPGRINTHISLTLFPSSWITALAAKYSATCDASAASPNTSHASTLPRSSSSSSSCTSARASPTATSSPRTSSSTPRDTSSSSISASRSACAIVRPPFLTVPFSLPQNGSCGG